MCLAKHQKITPFVFGACSTRWDQVLMAQRVVKFLRSACHIFLKKMFRATLTATPVSIRIVSYTYEPFNF